MNSIFNGVDKKRVVSTLFLYLSILSLGCDFESPQKWETPSWYLPLTVPLINTVYSFEGMAQDSTIIEDSLNNTLKIVFSNNIVEDGGDRPGITDDIFNFEIDETEQTDIFNQDFAIDKLPSEKIGGETISIPIPIFAFHLQGVNSLADPSPCFSTRELDKPVFNQFPDGVPNTFQILSTLGSALSEVKLGETSIIQKVHLLTVTGGKLGVSYINELPFPVKSFIVEFISYEYTDQIISLRKFEFYDIEKGGEGPEDLGVNDITLDNPVKFGDSLLIELTIEIDTTGNYDKLGAIENACNFPSFPFPPEDGWVIEPNQIPQFLVNLEFEIAAQSATEIFCTTNPIVIDTTINTEFPSIDKIDIKSGKITEEVSAIASNEVNYIELIANNSLFAPTTIEIQFDNFFDIEDGIDVPIILGGELPKASGNTTFSDTLASKYLGRPGEPDSILKAISVGLKIQINAIENEPIILGNTFALSISRLLMSKIKLAYLTAVTYDMGFDTPSSNIEGVPQGGVGLQFYDVQLILDIYTQIGIPIQLDMLLKGLKGEDSVLAVINPKLNVPEINTTGDSVRTIITLNKDGQKVEWYHMDNIDGEIPDSTIYTPLYEGQSSIVDVMNFTPETLEFGGGAKINGAGFLAPNSFLWGTFTLIAPLAFIFEEPVNILPAEPTAMEPMDPSTAQQIDSALVEAALNVTITNNSALGGSLSLLISDSTIFPLFLDSLITGTWDTNQQNQFDKYGYNFNTAIWDTLKPPMVLDSISFTAIDATDEESKALEVGFYNEGIRQFFCRQNV